MSRGRGTEFLLLQAVTDLLAVTAGLLVAYWLRFHAGLIPPGGEWDELLYLRQYPWALGLWWLSLHLTHNYQPHPRVISFNRARRLLKGSGLAVALIVARNYFWREPDVARLLYPVALTCVIVALLIGRSALQQIIVAYFMGRSLPRTRMMILGLGPTAFRLAARVKAHPEYAFDLIGFAGMDASRVGRRIGGVKVLGTVEELRHLIREHHIEDVFVAERDLPHEQLLKLFLESEMETARVHVIPHLVEMMRTPIFYDEVAGVPVYTIRETPLQGWNVIAKRVFDVCVAGVGLVLLAPLMAIIALLVKKSSPGPALYSQDRLGMDGRQFTIHKFRTMPVTAEAAGPGWGGQDDKRSTTLGKWLRRWNLDELPQLWNVVKGDMSLVGPRPERPVYVQQFKELFPRYMARHRVLTGITGWAQVHGLRGDTSISQRVRYDLYYIENWSLWLDVKILLMTFLNPRPRRKWKTFSPQGAVQGAEFRVQGAPLPKYHGVELPK